MLSYKTPGVYVEEIPTLPPSVVSVSTAVPAFIGYTEMGYPAAGEHPTAVKISSMLEYRALFGGPKAVKFKAEVTNPADGGQEVTIQGPNSGGPDKLQYIMYHSLELYFSNGGGPCYIVAVGSTTKATPAKVDFENGLEAIKRKDEPTLIVLTDAVKLSSTDYHTLCNNALTQCAELKDRFAIFDVRDTGAGASEDIKAFRDSIGMNDLKYGAAYFPHLKTSLNYHYKEEEVEVEGFSEVGQYESDPNGIKVTYNGPHTDTPQVILQKSGGTIGFKIGENKTLTIEGIGDDGKTPNELVEAWNEQTIDKQGFDIEINGNGDTNVTFVGRSAIDLNFSIDLSTLKTDQTASYNAIKQALARETMTLPPSSAVAGIYAKVDRERGVWKAPANVSLSSVIGPQHRITNEQQEGFNVDATTGKSINIIRSFQGKGTLVWGARTLAGNDNEWRYVSVRRLFNTIEESTQKATSFAVFEANDATTWLKVKALIENYLYGLWQLGALEGASPELAYYVKVGLGKTMTTQDVLEGRMNVEIGVATVRPAEFIILKFSHKMQEA